MAVGVGGFYAWSTNGASWTTGSISGNPILRTITYGANKYIALGDAGAYAASSDSYIISLG
jgi:hypothetical protein